MRKKVLFLITKSNFGGAQRYVYDLATSLPKNEFDVAVALGGDGLLAEKLHDARIRVIKIASLQRDVSFAKEIRAFLELIDIVRAERPRVLHINSSKAGAIGAIVGHLCRVPKIVFTAHGWAFNEDRPGWQRFILKSIHWLTVLLSDETIAVSREVKRQMNWPFTEKKMIVIHNGRSLPQLQSREAARAELIEREPRLRAFPADFWSLTIAELHPIKRHEAVIDVVKKLADRGENVRHLIIGGGEQAAALARQIERFELQDRVFLLGQIPEAADRLAAADCFVLASRSEAMPYAVIEAMIAGVPTVATAVGGIPEIIENGVSGLLVPPLDDEALAGAITRVLHDPELRDRLAAGARERKQDFTFEKTLARTVSVYTGK